jgi:uncharacterized protein
MILDLKNLFQGGEERLAFNFTLNLSHEDIGDVYPFKTPGCVKGEVTASAGVITLSGQAEYTYTAPCDSCGEEASVSRAVPVEYILVHELYGEEDDRFLLCVDMKLNAAQLFTEEILVTLPMRFLCKEDCKGACSVCGKNLNEGYCGCKRLTPDPRLEKLGEFF